MSQKEAGREGRNWGQGEQAAKKPPRIGHEEELVAHVVVFNISPASSCRLEAQLWGPRVQGHPLQGVVAEGWCQDRHLLGGCTGVTTPEG